LLLLLSSEANALESSGSGTRRSAVRGEGGYRCRLIVASSLAKLLLSVELENIEDCFWMPCRFLFGDSG
jgi:hypothetical protein